MAITLQCPRCMNKQQADEAKIGAEVPCKVCYHMLAVAEAKSKNEPPRTVGKSQAKADPDAPIRTGIKKSGTTALSAKNPPPADEGPRRRRRRDVEEDDDWDRERSQRARAGRDSSALTGLLIGGGIFVALALLCGGGGMAAFLFTAGEPRPPEPMPPMAVALEEPVRAPLQPAPFPPPPEKLDPNDPATMARVLELLAGPAPQRTPAFRWLRQADPNHPRRAELARRLEAIAREHMQNPFGNADFFNAYFRWATKENVPSLLQIVQADQQHRGQALRTLGKLKDERAIEPMTRQLEDFFNRHAAADALKDMGPMAEKAVVKQFNHQDIATRNLARDLLRGYDTKSGLLLTQCLADVDAPDASRRSAALQWIAKCPVDAERKIEVSKALIRAIDDPQGSRNRDLVAALEVWGTKENIPRLAQLATQGQFGNRDAVRILGKMRDQEATKAVAAALSHFFVAGEARKTLKEIGSEAEPAVIEAMMKVSDPRKLRDYIGLLGEIGTRARSLPALAALQMRMPADRFLNVLIQQSAKMIQARGN